VAKKELNLFQFSAGGAAESSATSTKIVRRQFGNANSGGELLDDVPDELFRYSLSQSSTGATHVPEKPACVNSGRLCPFGQQAMHPIRDGNSSNVTSPSAQVHNCPMPFALLKMANGQHHQLVPPKPAGEQKCKKCPITFTLHLPAVGRLPQSLPLLGGQPVAKPYSQFLYAVDSPYPSSQVCAEEPAVGCLVRKTAHGSKTKVDRTGSEIAGFQMHSVPEDHGFAERQPRLGTIPLHEFVDRVPVPALSIGTGKAVEDSGFRDL